MGLTADGGRLVGEYSGGMVRRLEIAQSTLHRPRVLFLDEPTVGWTDRHATLCWKHLVDLQANYGTTLFFTTHTWKRLRAIVTGWRSCTWEGRGAGTCKELKASLGEGGHSLNDVFVHYAGTALDSGGTFHSVSAERAYGPAPRLD